MRRYTFLALALSFLFGSSVARGQGVAPVGELKKVPKIDPVGQLAPITNDPIASSRPLTNGPYVVFYNRKVVDAGSWEWTPYTYPTEEATPRRAAAEYQTRAGLESRAMYEKVDAKRWQTDRATVVDRMRSTTAKVSQTERVARGITISAPVFHDVARVKSDSANHGQTAVAVTGAANGTFKGVTAGAPTTRPSLEGTRWGHTNVASGDTTLEFNANGVAHGWFAGDWNWTQQGNNVTVRFVHDGEHVEVRGTVCGDRIFARIYLTNDNEGMAIQPLERYP